MKQKIYSFKLSLALSAIFLLALSSSCRDDETIIRTVEVMKEDTCMFDMNRAALLKMDVGGEIVVMGHKSQDPDAVCSAISMATLMRELGMNAVPYLQEKPIQGVKYILDNFCYPYPNVKCSIEAGAPLVLTDHNDPLQSVEGMAEANVVGVVDHHNVSMSFNTGLPIYYRCMNVGSACTIIYNIYKECGIVPNPSVAQLMLAGIIADTDSLGKVTSTDADSLALTELVSLSGVENLHELTEGISLALDSYDGMTDEEIFLSDCKVYSIGGVKLAITSLNANEKMHISELCDRMCGVMPVIRDSLDVQMVFAKMEEKFYPDLENLDSVTYSTHFAYFGDGARTVAEKAYGLTAEKHNDCIVLSRKLSRKTDIVPDLTKVLTQ